MAARINMFEQIRAFYSWVFDNQEFDIKPQHMALYMFLLNQNNRNNWIEWFKCPYDLGMAGSGIGSKKTYYNCLNNLQDWELIKYKKGVNEYKAPLIKIEVLKSTSAVPHSEPQPEPQVIPLPEPLPTHIYRLITLYLKPITNNIEKVIEFLDLDTQEQDVIKFEETKNNILNSFSFIEQLQRISKLPEEAVKTKVETLLTEWKACGDIKRTPLDYRTHLLNKFKQDYAKGKETALSPIERLKQLNNEQHSA